MGGDDGPGPGRDSLAAWRTAVAVAGDYAAKGAGDVYARIDHATVSEVDRMVSRLAVALAELIEASRPFTSPAIVDETDGTLPLMDRLEAAVERAGALLRNSGR